MTWDDIAKQQGYSPSDIQAFQSWGYSPDSMAQALQAGVSVQGMADAYSKGLTPEQYLGNVAGYVPPEQAAAADVARIDPQTAALRNQLGQSYLNQVSNQPQVSMPGVPTNAAPTAGAINSYLDTYRGVDPTGLAARQQLESDLAAQEKLGAQLDPETAREVEQQTRLAQSARGNVYGTPELVAEAMQRGQAGEARQRQRQQDLQSFLQSGQDVGSVGQNLYEKGQADYLAKYQNYLNAWNAQQANTRANQQGALSYLTSGATPYATQMAYVDRATGASQAATPSYNTGVSGQSPSYNQGSYSSYGTQTASDAQSMYQQMLQAYGMQPLQKNRAAGALGGAISGGIAGIPLAGATYGGSVVGGAAVGALGGYYS